MELSKFQIIFYDGQMKELFIKWTEQLSYEDAEVYAMDIMATTSYDNVQSCLINKI